VFEVFPPQMAKGTILKEYSISQEQTMQNAKSPASLKPVIDQNWRTEQ
jgi:hypothetical protein